MWPLMEGLCWRWATEFIALERGASEERATSRASPTSWPWSTSSRSYAAYGLYEQLPPPD